MIRKPESFGIVKDTEVFLYTISSDKLIARISDFGATIVQLFYCDGDNRTNMVCGYDSVEPYIMNDSYMGAVVLPCANRTRNASFKLNGKEYHLQQNDGKNNLHSSLPDGSAQAIWSVENYADNSLTLKLSYGDGELGFPGNRVFMVTYEINNNELSISYSAISDQDSVFNPTNHSYFNLNGKGTVLDHELKIYADNFTPNDSTSVPVGSICPVENTPFDFREFKPIGKDINQDHEQLIFGKGYDHNWLINGFDGSVKLIAELYSPANDLLLKTYTCCPGIQVYTANYLNNDKYSYRDAVCLETQYTPDAINLDNMVKPILKAGKWCTLVTKYAVSKKES